MTDTIIVVSIEDVLDLAEPMGVPVENDEDGLAVYGTHAKLDLFLTRFAAIVQDEVGGDYLGVVEHLIGLREVEADPDGGPTFRHSWHGISAK